MADKEIQVYEKLVWCLDDMSKEKIEACQVGEAITSKPTIIEIGSSDTSWALCFYPGGSEENKDSIGMSLHLVKGCSFIFKAKAGLGIVGKKWTEVESEEQSGEFFKTPSALFLMRREDLCDPDNGYLIGGKLKLYCNLSLFANEVLDSEKSASLNQSLQGHFKRMMSDTVFVDFKVETSDGQVLQVHKNVLAFRSPYFFGMLTTKMKEAKDNIAMLPEDAVIIKEVLRFIYCNEVENLNAIAFELVLAAEKYQLDDLKQMCIDSIIKSMSSVENILQAVLLADVLSNSEKFMDKCIERVASNFELLKKSDDWKKLSANLLTEIISYTTRDDQKTTRLFRQPISSTVLNVTPVKRFVFHTPSLSPLSP